MPTHTVSVSIPTPAETVWSTLADFADVSWIPLAGDVRVEGSGPGMQRFIGGSGSTPVVETLTALEPDRRTISYDVANNPLGCERFHVTATVAGDVDTTATFVVDFSATADDEKAVADVEAIYSMIAGWLADHCAPAGARDA
ncbi:SRPBCC family protein [uncultured Williamsia sp.]|uniref:SRPBCC family protein n=1 Tax=uncultured Williamsia sp. TaxID=259311 RepID=UPI0026135CF2|nr:SRPBCC family protein [uncultured Williamsia sp.]